MAATLEDFKRQFDAIKAKVVTYAAALDKDQRFMGQTTGIIKEGVKEVGLRVQELKSAGRTGATIDKFMFDPEVSKMVSSIRQYLAALQKQVVLMTALHAEIKTTVKSFSDLKVAVANEIALRKKQLSTKLGTGNKSLPEMEKLLAEMRKYTDQSPFANVEVYVPERYDAHLNETNNGLNRECSQARDVALSAFQAQMTEQALNTRVLNGNVNKARTWYDAIMKSCAAGQKALATRNNKELLTAKALVVKPMKDLTDMNTMYQNALKDQWIAGQLKGSKDRSTIEGGIKLLLDMKTKAGAEVAKIANARL
jgi:hypothetical protein